jgi:hypothetical protein
MARGGGDESSASEPSEIQAGTRMSAHIDLDARRIHSGHRRHKIGNSRGNLTVAVAADNRATRRGRCDRRGQCPRLPKVRAVVWHRDGTITGLPLGRLAAIPRLATEQT